MEIYYFSGTGNCLSVARIIAEKTNARLISIPNVMSNQSVKTNSNRIGIVFPCYLTALSGVPLIVERFLRKLENIESKYLFAICTCGGYEIVNALPTLKNLKKIIRSFGGRLSAEYSVRLPMNNLDYDHIPVPINTNQDTIFKNCEKKIDHICLRIQEKKVDKHRFLKICFNSFMTPMYNMMKKPVIMALKKYAKESETSTLGYKDLIPLTDKSIVLDGNCDGCSICAKICPVQNIEIVANKPVWKHHCEMCFACDEWCPQNAIHHWSRTDGVKYHHPSVTKKDIILESRKDLA